MILDIFLLFNKVFFILQLFLLINLKFYPLFGIPFFPYHRFDFSLFSLLVFFSPSILKNTINEKNIEIKEKRVNKNWQESQEE